MSVPVARRAAIDHAEQLIDSIARQLAHDSGGEDRVTFMRGDGRSLAVPTFHSELLAPYLEKLRPFRATEGGAGPPPALLKEGDEIRGQREQRIREWLDEHRELVAAYVKGD